MGAYVQLKHRAVKSTPSPDLSQRPQTQTSSMLMLFYQSIIFNFKYKIQVKLSEYSV